MRGLELGVWGRGLGSVAIARKIQEAATGCRVLYEEWVVALLATDLAADVGPPDAQGSLAARTGHDEAILLGRRWVRWNGFLLARDHGARFHRLLGQEDLITSLAADLLA